MTEAEIRLDERRRITLTMTILMLPEHPDLLDRLDSAINNLPELPLYSEARTVVIGHTTRREREGDQVPGMPHAICHGCGLGYKCMDADCPNDKPNPAF